MFFELGILVSEDLEGESRRQLMSNLACFHHNIGNSDAQELYLSLATEFEPVNFSEKVDKAINLNN